MLSLASAIPAGFVFGKGLTTNIGECYGGADQMRKIAMPVPPGFAVVTPYIFATGADAYVRFLEAAFGAKEIGRSTAPDGRIANCQLRFDTATIMVSEASEAFPPSHAALYLYVDDADAAVLRAVAAGADKIMDVDDMPYGDRQGGVRDPSGNIWWVSHRLSSEPYF